jgi:hypothetical protein
LKYGGECFPVGGEYRDPLHGVFKR